MIFYLLLTHTHVSHTYIHTHSLSICVQGQGEHCGGAGRADRLGGGAGGELARASQGGAGAGQTSSQVPGQLRHILDSRPD